MDHNAVMRIEKADQKIGKISRLETVTDVLSVPVWQRLGLFTVYVPRTYNFERAMNITIS